jgi:A/G-specific adenine glycosylase
MKARNRGKQLFTRLLMEWHEEHNDRQLPWKQESDPYKIWLSEIILQQTRAAQGLPYYLRFTESYPDVNALANAPEEEVFRLWQGLGYYNRCKNLLHTARTIAGQHDGKFPDTYEQILALKGIGSYTAAAIASFAFNLPHAVVDGNVYRVLSRYFGIDTPIDTTEGKKEFQLLANELLDHHNSSGYNQAIMDHGATVCTPAAPRCEGCVLQRTCVALQQNLVNLLPVKSRKLAVRKRYFHYILLHSGNGGMWIRKRRGKDIWENLYEPFLIEHPEPLQEDELAAHPSYVLLSQQEAPSYEGLVTQRLTHQIIESRFFSVKNIDTETAGFEQGEWVSFSALKKFPFPRTLVSFLEKKLYF